MFIDEATFSLIKKTVHKNGLLELPSEGMSMFPLIYEGDHCHFVRCDPDKLKRAEIALFYARSGQLVAHRFYKKEMIQDETIYYFKGDTNLGFDEPVVEEQIVGKLVFLNRGKRKIRMDGRLVRLWSRLIIAFPILSELLQKYLHWKTHLRSEVSK